MLLMLKNYKISAIIGNKKSRQHDCLRLFILFSLVRCFLQLADVSTQA
jgi:hypothetical protein